MSGENGFLKLRRGLWEHRRDGRMSVTEALAFIYVCSEADTRTGIWKGCAKALSGELGIPERTARDVLEKMERSGYVRRFTSPGSHTCYPILVHKFSITTGQHHGELLNAMDSKSPSALAYLPREQGVELNGEHGVEHGAAQKRIENKEKKREKKNPVAEPTPPDVPAAVWVAFVEHRQKLRRPLTVHAAELVRQKLEKLKAAGHDPTQLLETAMERGWLTVFEPDERRGRWNGESFAERNIRRAQEELGDVSRRAQQALSHVGGDLPEPPGHQGDGRILPRSIERPNTRAN